MKMKDHLINKHPVNKYSIITHRIILIVLLIILIYEFTFDNYLNIMHVVNLKQINLYLNIFYYLLCFISDCNKSDTKKSYQIYFHFCFSISSSLPLLYLFLGIVNLGNNYFFANTSFISIGMIISPFILNLLETLIIKRYKPAYINLIFLFLFLTLYYCIMYFVGKIGLIIEEQYLKYFLDIKYLVSIYITTIIGAFLGWFIYKIVTRPKMKKINLDSSELSEE